MFPCFEWKKGADGGPTWRHVFCNTFQADVAVKIFQVLGLSVGFAVMAGTSLTLFPLFSCIGNGGRMVES